MEKQKIYTNLRKKSREDQEFRESQPKEPKILRNEKMPKLEFTLIYISISKLKATNSEIANFCIFSVQIHTE